MALGGCSAYRPGVESRTLERNGVTALRSAYRVHRRDAATALLDGGDSRLPPPEQIRARLLFSVSIAVFSLRRILARSKLANTLFAASNRAQSVCDCHHFRGSVHFARSSLTSARGIRRNAGNAKSEAMEVGHVIPFLCGLFSSGLPSDSPSPARATLQFSRAWKFLRGGIRHRACRCAGMVRHLAMALHDERSRPAAALFSCHIVAVFHVVVSSCHRLALRSLSSANADRRIVRNRFCFAARSAFCRTHLPRLAA